MTTQPTAERFPLDFDALQKGDIVPAETIEAAYGVTRDDRAYPLSVLRLKKEIEVQLEALGRPVTTKGEGDCIRVLTDEEALVYNARSFESDVRGLYRAQRRMMQIDAAQLSESSRESHTHALQVQAMQCLALRKVRKQIQLEPHKNETPQIGDGGEPT